MNSSKLTTSLVISVNTKKFILHNLGKVHYKSLVQGSNVGSLNPVI